MADWSGAMGAATVWANGDRITGNVTVPNGADVTVNAGATITFQGAYSVTISGTGRFVCTGTAAARIVFRSGATEPRDNDWVIINLQSVSSTGNSFQYTDFSHGSNASGVLAFGVVSGGGVADVAFCRFFDIGGGGIIPHVPSGTSGQTLVVRNCEFWNIRGGQAIMQTSTSAITTTIQDCYFHTGTTAGIIIQTATVHTVTINRCLFEGMVDAISQTGTNDVVTVQNCIYHSGATTGAAFVRTTAGTTAGSIAVTNNIIGAQTRFGRGIYQNAAAGPAVTSSNNDFEISGVANYDCIQIVDTDNGSTSNNDYMAGALISAYSNLDQTELTTSNETDPGYSGLTSARTNARATANFPATIDTVADTATADGATITWNSNRPMNSEVYFAEATGIDTNDPTTYDGAFLMDDDWANLSGRGTYKDRAGGMTGTAHSVTLAGLRAATTYYYVLRGVDPAGNTAVSAEGSFLTTGAAGGGGGSDTGGGGGRGRRRRKTRVIILTQAQAKKLLG